MQTIEMPTTEMPAFNVPALPDDATTLFRDPVAMEEHLQSYRDLVAASSFDVTTAKGRGQAKSLAYAISQHKVALDDFGKSMTEDAKKAIAVIDTERRKARETLDELRDQAKGAALAWEDAERERVEALDLRMQAFLARPPLGATLADLEAMLEQVEAVVVDETWQERQLPAEGAKEVAVEMFRELIAEKRKQEADAAELARLRQEAVERLEREQKALAEQEAKEREAAAEKAQREREEAAAARAKADADAAAAKAIADAKAAQEAAEKAKGEAEARERVAAAEAKAREERAAENAAAAERARAAQEKARKDAADAKALAQKKRRAKIKEDIAEVIAPMVREAGSVAGLCDTIAEEIIEGRVPWVKIDL